MNDPRFTNRKILKDNSESIQPLLDRRGLTSISHFTSAKFNRLTDEQLAQLSVKTEFWQNNTAFWKLAAKHYNNQPQFWWVIALFNESPTEQHMQPGKPVMIPFPLEKVIKMFGLGT